MRKSGVLGLGSLFAFSCGDTRLFLDYDYADYADYADYTDYTDWTMITLTMITLITLIALMVPMNPLGSTTFISNHSNIGL